MCRLGTMLHNEAEQAKQLADSYVVRVALLEEKVESFTQSLSEKTAALTKQVWDAAEVAGKAELALLKIDVQRVVG